MAGYSIRNDKGVRVGGAIKKSREPTTLEGVHLIPLLLGTIAGEKHSAHGAELQHVQLPRCREFVDALPDAGPDRRSCMLCVR